MAKEKTKTETAGRTVIFKTVVKTSSNINFESVTTTNKEFTKGDKIFDDKATITKIKKIDDKEIIALNFEFTKEMTNIDKVNLVSGYGFKEV